MKYNRFIALGDSFTEGICDEKKYGQYRGWADRVADVMAANQPGFQYANLAIRGKLLRQIIDGQIEPALAQVVDKTTLVSFHAGVNDVIRPKYNPNLVLPVYAEAARKVAASGATVMLFTVLEDNGKEGRYFSTVAAQYIPYVRPQENGGHFAVRWFEVTSGGGNGLRFQMSKPAQVSVTPNRDADLADSTHDVEVKPSGNSVVHIDTVHRGVGTASCGPDTLDKYIIKPGTHTWEWSVTQI